MKGKEIVIIGGGPGGYVAALRAAQEGAKVRLVEKDALGGTCLNRGCIPMKAMLKCGQVYELLQQVSVFGISIKDPAIDFSKVIRRRNAVTNQLLMGVTALLQDAEIEVIKGEASFVSEDKIQVVQNDASSLEIEGDAFIIATGSKPTLPKIPGIDLPEIYASEEIFNINELPDRLLILGGGVIALEFAYLFNALGVDVTMVVRSRLLRTSVDNELATILTNHMSSKGVDIRLKNNVENISKVSNGLRAVIIDEEGNRCQEDYSDVLVCTGRKANTHALHLHKAGIALDKHGYIEVDNRMRTNKPNVYAIGDVIGGMQLAHLASREGEIAVLNALGYEAVADYRAVPNCVFTNPEIGCVGLTEAEAIAAGYQVKIGRFPFIASGKALADNETLGLVKFVADAKDDKILGVHIMGPQASVLICEGVLALQMGASLSDITETIHAHPTLGEAFAEAALQANDRAFHLTKGILRRIASI